MYWPRCRLFPTVCFPKLNDKNNKELNRVLSTKALGLTERLWHGQWKKTDLYFVFTHWLTTYTRISEYDRNMCLIGERFQSLPSDNGKKPKGYGGQLSLNCWSKVVSFHTFILAKLNKRGFKEIHKVVIWQSCDTYHGSAFLQSLQERIQSLQCYECYEPRGVTISFTRWLYHWLKMCNFLEPVQFHNA